MSEIDGDWKVVIEKDVEISNLQEFDEVSIPWFTEIKKMRMDI